MRERASEFRALEQEHHLSSSGLGEFGGFYVSRSRNDVVAHRSSESAATITTAHRFVVEPQVEVFEVLMPPCD